MRYTVSPIVGRLLWPAWLRVLFAPAAVSRRFQSFPAWMALRPLQLRAMAEDAALLLPAAHAMASEYPKLKVPTVIIAGADDRYVSARAHMVHHVAAAQVLRAIEQEPAQVG